MIITSGKATRFVQKKKENRSEKWKKNEEQNKSCFSICWAEDYALEDKKN